MTTIEKMEKGIITLAEFTEGQQSFIRGIVKLSFNEGQEQALRIHDVIKSVCPKCGSDRWIKEGDYCECTECMTLFKQTVL
jgi:hypothetical protein